MVPKSVRMCSDIQNVFFLCVSEPVYLVPKYISYAESPENEERAFQKVGFRFRV